MSKCLTLLKVQLLGFFGINRLFHSGGGREKRKMALVAAGLVGVLAIIAAYVVMICVGLASVGMAEVIPTMMITVCAAVTLMFTLLKSNGLLFGFRDYDTVMSLPVSEGTVIASRLLSVYVTNAAVTLIIMIPTMVIYGTAAQAGLQVWLMALLSLFLIPVLPIIVGMIAGAVITAVAVRFRHGNIVTIVLGFAATLAVILLSSVTPEDGAQLAAEVSGTIKTAYPPAALFTGAIVGGSWADFTKFAAVSVVPAVLFVAVLSRFYTKLNSALFSRRVRSDYKVGSLKTSAPFAALLKKEARRLITCPVYMLNTCMGILLLLALSVGVMFMNLGDMESALGMPGMSEWIKSCAPLLIALFTVISPITSVSMNMEGKSRWIPFSLPVEPITVFNAKIALNLLLDIPAILIAGTLFAVRFGANLTETLVLILLPIVYAFFASVAGMLINLNFPKYDWTSEYHAVKNSVSTLVTLLAGFVAAGVPFALGLMLPDYVTAINSSAAVITALVTAILYLRLKKKTVYVY